MIEIQDVSVDRIFQEWFFYHRGDGVFKKLRKRGDECYLFIGSYLMIDLSPFWCSGGNNTNRNETQNKTVSKNWYI